MILYTIALKYIFVLATNPDPCSECQNDHHKILYKCDVQFPAWLEKELRDCIDIRLDTTYINENVVIIIFILCRRH